MSKNNNKLIKSKIDVFFLFALFVISTIAWVFHTVSMNVKPVKYKVSILLANETKNIIIDQVISKTMTVEGELGETVIEWDEQGRVRIVSSACPNNTCVSTGWINHSSVICVPNRVVVEAVTNQQPEFDAISR